MPETDVYFLSSLRTAIGDFGGALKDQPPATLGTHVARAAIAKAGLAPDDLQHAVFGSVLHTEPRDMYVSRVIAVEAGVPISAPAMTINRLCGSGLQAIISAAQMIRLGDSSVVLAGGTKSMSRSAYMLPAARWGQKMGDAPLVDMMIGVLNDPFGNGHMGVTAENVSQRYHVSREEQDAAAVESHRRAAAAIRDGRFESQIVPFEITSRKGTTSFAIDEHVRSDVSLADMTRLRPAFRKDGTVTAGNASGINDGAAAVVLADSETVKARGLDPQARLVSYAMAGVDPSEMGMGPVPAVRAALAKAGLAIGAIDVIESNEAFAAQACAVSRTLDLDPAKVNPNGGAIALGHPIGATGAIITVKAIHELQRTGSRYALVTMCIGGGQGIAMVLERQ